MTSKIFRSTVFVAAMVLLLSLAIIMGVMYRHFTGVQVAQLKDELSLAVTATEQYGNAFLENVEADRFRITWVAANGTVLFDTRAEAEQMENHADREEIRQALETGSGSSERYSATLTGKTFYEAKKLSDGSVLRISSTQASVGALVLGMLQPIIIVALIAIALSAFLAGRMAKAIVEPLNRLDLEHPLQNEAYDEVAPLLRRINQQRLQIDRQVQTLRQKANEFEQITTNMQEGLVLLDRDCTILSINPTAGRLFDAGNACVGRSFFSIERSADLRSAVNAALDHGHGMARAQRCGRDYQFDLSRIESDGEVLGAVLLAFDITQSLRAEQTRREFSANVSHELKTPLQSIMGSAELLENGLVRQEDTARFVGNIRKEAARLLALIEDIIRLSQLDEGAPMPSENVDLLQLCREVAQTLSDAHGTQIALQVHGESCTITGVRRLLYEIIYNLCDNGIKYNVPGGRVDVSVCRENDHAVLTVADTGIGIPEGHIDRIFERFYRVDKSHSKQSGGTGLGLSIVKHAVQYHGAKLEVHSTPGKGTTMIVTF
ncbi:MAG: PAS domain-containing protein [Oscillospiraceae bacterium]|nr:PAS domain-containing protein [Oscillospiraceae bacterium]